MVPTVKVVFSAISRSICKLACRMYGTLNCGETREMSGDAPNRGELTAGYWETSAVAGSGDLLCNLHLPTTAAKPSHSRQPHFDSSGRSCSYRTARILHVLRSSMLVARQIRSAERSGETGSDTVR